MKTLRLILLLQFLFFSLLTSAQNFIFQSYDESQTSCVKLTSDSCYLIAGVSNYNHLDENFLLIKINRYGDTVFCKIYTDNFAGMKAVRSLEAANGEFFFLGAHYGSTLLIKTDDIGNVLWNKLYSDTLGINPVDFCLHSDGSITILGRSNNTISLFKVDSLGSLLLSKRYYTNITAAKAICLTPSNKYVVAAYRYTPSNAEITVLLNLDSIGNINWAKEYSQFEIGKGNSILIGDNEEIIMAGAKENNSNYNDGVLIKTDSAGVLMWSYYFHGLVHENFNGISNTFNNGYAITGNTFNSSTAAYPNDVSLINVDSSGLLSWSSRFDLSQNDVGYSIYQTNDSDFVIAGTYGAWGITNWPQIFLMKTYQYGINQCLYNSILPLSQYQYAITVSPTVFADSIYTLIADSIASFSNTQQLQNVTCLVNTGVENTYLNNSVTTFPNPSNGAFKIRFENNLVEGVCLITNVFGQTIWKKEIQNRNSVDVNIGNFSNGIYFLTFIGKDFEIKRKLILSK